MENYYYYVVRQGYLLGKFNAGESIDLQNKEYGNYFRTKADVFKYLHHIIYRKPFKSKKSIIEKTKEVLNFIKHGNGK